LPVFTDKTPDKVLSVQLQGCKNVNTYTNRRSGKDRRAASYSATFPLHDNQGIIVATDRRNSCDRRTGGLELTETNLSQKVFQAIYKKYLPVDV